MAHLLTPARSCVWVFLLALSAVTDYLQNLRSVQIPHRHLLSCAWIALGIIS